jgi:glycosyltransferase involved in cell wall biosynthesis
VPSAPRRVLFIVSAYQRGDGDVVTPWLNTTIAELGRAGIDAEVLAPAFRGSPSHTIDGVRVHRFRYAPAAYETLSHDAPIPSQLSAKPSRVALVPGYMAAAAIEATRLAKRGRFDAMHAFWPIPHALPALLARGATNVPLVSTFFGAELHWLASKNSFMQQLTRAIVRRSDAVTAISTFTAEALRKIVPDVQPTIIPFGAAIAPSRVGGAPTRAPARTEGPKFLFVGRLVGRKGVDVLLRAFASTHPPATDRSREATLTIIGDGEDRLALETLARSLHIADRVTFTGYLSRVDLDGALRGCTAVVLPAVPHRVLGTEGLGVAIIEAMSYGRAVIASDTGGIRDVVVHDETGLLVSPGDATALAAAMQRLIDEPALVSRLGAAGEAHVAARFAWPAIVDALRGVYRRAMEARRP